MEDQAEKLGTEYRQNQQSYRYYLIGLTVTAIGFAIYNTIGLPLKWIQIPLGLAVIFWALSVFFGLTYLKYNLSITIDNISYLNIRLYNTEAIAKGLEMQDKIKAKLKTANNYSSVQEFLFYSGIISFIIWHILEMYSISKI